MDTVKEMRRRRGWSQKDLAKASGVGQDTISGLESGRHEPRPSTLRKIASALDVEVADLFQEIGSPKVAPLSPDWAMAASDDEFEDWAENADLSKILTLLPLLNRTLKELSADEHETRRRMLDRATRLISEWTARVGPFHEVLSRGQRARLSKEQRERRETA